MHGMMNPIPKNAISESRKSLSYRVVVVALSMHRLCGILNTDFILQAQVNYVIMNEQMTRAHTHTWNSDPPTMQGMSITQRYATEQI